ncbi:hypothetical protein F503_07442 [Ophiostoma piceae UAMH 11346]|uniref:Uncharacterized protein n=1 Tax=Ophiostoma piceae (strain UAMH 11346) TaxID=1262450 RepID=S3CCG2_OPHP1|nr:hypothetical protein F503_07442 [Ophiostoma piceae UAMH 11346]
MTQKSQPPGSLDKMYRHFHAVVVVVVVVVMRPHVFYIFDPIIPITITIFLFVLLTHISESCSWSALSYPPHSRRLKVTQGALHTAAAPFPVAAAAAAHTAVAVKRP